MAFAVVTTSAQLCLPWLMKGLFDILSKHGDNSGLHRVCTLIVTVAVITVVSDIGRTYFTVAACQQILLDIRNQVYSHLRRLPFSYFQMEQTGRIMSILTSDAPMLITLYSPVLDEACLGGLQLLVIASILFAISGWLTLLIPVAVVIYLALPLSVASPLRAWGSKIQTKNADLSADLQESLSGTREITVFNRDGWDVQRLANRFGAFPHIHKTVALLNSATYANIILYWAVVALIYAVGGGRVLAGRMSLGALVAVIWYIALLDDPLRRIAGMHGKLQTAVAAASRVFEVLDTPIPTCTMEILRSQPLFSGYLEFENVSFSYGEKRVALSDVAFSVCPGQRVVIAGRSGAGKTTLVNLVPRLHEPTSGRILIDGVDIRSIELDWLRSQIGVLFQDVFLFNSSVRDNIRFGRLDATDEEIVAAAHAANAHEFTVALPSGYETHVGERGVALSGGQKQRIAIARTILFDPRILILDEATSALDSQTEVVVWNALERLMKGRTTIVIDHRPSALFGADKIVVLDQGRVVGCGSHADLVRNCPSYRELHTLPVDSWKLPVGASEH
jgi:subfamily B ATP-binding cassette protein MsbA